MSSVNRTSLQGLVNGVGTYLRDFLESSYQHSLPFDKLERISKPLENFGMMDVYVHPVRSAMGVAPPIASQTTV